MSTTVSTTVGSAAVYQPPADLQQRAALVQASLAQAERHLRRVQRTDVRAVVATLVASGAATVLAGIPAAAGRAVGTGSWRITCAITAALAAVGTVVTALRQHVAGSERVAKAEACVGRLRALSYGTSVGAISAADVDSAYQDILKEYPAILS